MSNRCLRNLARIFPLLALSCHPADADEFSASSGIKQWFGQQPVLPALDSPLVFARKTTVEICPNCTAEILSLVFEQGPTAGPVHLWPLYIQLDTASANGDATGTNARIYNRSTGWTAAHHGEGIAYSPGSVNIGYNAELSPMVSGSRMIGLNLQAKNGYFNKPAGHWSNEAINIQSDVGVGWKTGIRFDRVRTETAIDLGPESSGNLAIRIRGRYGIGLDMGNNSIRLDSGTRVCFEESNRICLRYNARRARLEFLNGSAVLAYLNAARAANRCLNC